MCLARAGVRQVVSESLMMRRKVLYLFLGEAAENVSGESFVLGFSKGDI